MLKNYSELAQTLEEKIKSIDFWPEIKFDTTDKENLNELESIILVNDHSLQLKIKDNHVILPSQYILYAVSIKALALSVKQFLDAFEKLKTKFNTVEICEMIINKSLSFSTLDLDDYSKKIGPEIFFNPSFNLGAKSIVNKDKKGKYTLRGTADFFSSIILKPINIPQASSSILGSFIFNLCENIELYNYLERKFINKIPYIIKNDITKVFAREVFSFLYQYDNLNAIEDTIEKNKDSNFTSIKNDGISLTSIFKTSTELLNPTDLSFEDGRLRYFTEPLFINDNKFYYFSTEWTNGKERRLDLVSLKKLIDKFYPEFELTSEDSVHLLLSKRPEIISEEKSTTAKNIIFYGAPGTGKSHKIDTKIEDLDNHFFERVTFHPEFDNISFIGGYKPRSVKIKHEDEGGEYFETEIHYEFVSQSFTSIYERAWKDLDNPYYLVIEEINRGNCAEIFGEIFQLLDRTSKYTVSPSKELQEYLEGSFKDKNHLGIKNGLKLPKNLSILATMNTSDQSLFPMDSAFKRRWDWEYIPICYDPTDDFENKNESYYFEIDIEDGKKYSWIKFIEKINLNHINDNKSLGMDKCIGNYFIKPDIENTISLKPFINKVIFYLWNDVFKDEDNNVFEENSSYENFFPISKNGKKKIKELFDRIELNPIP